MSQLEVNRLKIVSPMPFVRYEGVKTYYIYFILPNYIFKLTKSDVDKAVKNINKSKSKSKKKKGNVRENDKEKTADEIISESQKGRVRREFHSEWLNKTKAEIEKAAKKGDKVAKKARKLLRDNDFKKTSNSVRSKKGK